MVAPKKVQVKLSQPVSSALPMDSGLEDFDEPLAEAPPAEPEEPAVRTRKDSAPIVHNKKKESAPIQPASDLILDKKGAVRKDADGEDMRYAAGEHPVVGFVTESGVLFPNGYRFKGGHIANGTVVLNRCPKCGHHQGIDDAISGICGNQKCRFSQHHELEEYTLK